MRSAPLVSIALLAAATVGCGGSSLKGTSGMMTGDAAGADASVSGHLDAGGGRDGATAPPADGPAPAGPDDGAPPPDTARAPDAGAPLSAETVWRACGDVATALTAVAHAPDGRWMAVGYGDGRVTIIELTGMTVAGRLATGARSGVDRLAFSADGNTLVTLAASAVKTWSVPDGKQLRELGSGVPGGSNLQVTAGPAPLVLAAGSGGLAARIWRLDGPMVGAVGEGSLAAFTDEARAVVVVNDAVTDEPLPSITTLALDGRMIRKVSVARVYLPALSPDGTFMATVADEANVQHVELYSTLTGRRLWRSVEGTRPTRQLVFLADPPRLLQLGAESHIYDLATGQRVAGLGFPDAVNVHPSADGARLAALSALGTVALVTVADGSARPGPTSEFGIMERIVTFAVSRDGRRLAATGLDATWVFDLREHTLVRALKVRGFKPDLSPDGRALAMGGYAPAVYRVDDGHKEWSIEPGADAPCMPSLVFSPDGQILASGTCGRVELYRRDGTKMGERRSFSATPGVAFSPDGKWLATTGPELWPVDGMTPRWPTTILPPPDNGPLPVRDDVVAFSPDGKLLLVSRSRGYLSLRDWTTLTTVLQASDGATVRDLSMRIGRRPSFSPDGSWVAGAGAVLHLETLKHQSINSTFSVTHFLPDGRFVSYGSDRIARFFCPM